MSTFHVLNLRTYLRLITALLFLVIAFFGAGARIEPGLALSRLPADLPGGNHDGAEGVTDRAGCNANGWAMDPDDLARDLQVRILSDGSQVATVTADQFREDLVGICDEGTCGFDTSLWGLISPGEEHVITAQAFDEETASWVTLPGSPKVLTCWGYPEGNHDGNEGVTNRPGCNANGWAMDPDDPIRDLQVRILSDGSQVATATTDELRFYTSLWGLISTGVEHEITAQAFDEETVSWITLPGSPKTLTCWGFPEGNYDGSEGHVFEPACNASGWVMDPDDSARDLQVRILSDGSQVAIVTADQLREDLVEICDEGTCGFYTSLWGQISTGVEHAMIAQAYDQESASWVDVDETPKLLTCQDWLRIWAPVITRNSTGGP